MSTSSERRMACFLERISRVTAWGLTTLLFLVPLWVFPLSFGAMAAKTLLVSLGALILLGLSIAATHIAEPTRVVRIPVPFVALLSLIAAGLISLTVATNRCFGLQSIFILSGYAGLGLLFFRHTRTEAAMLRSLGALLLAASAAGVLAILQYVGWIGDPLSPAVDRVSSTFGNRNYLGSFVAAISFPCAVLCTLPRRTAVRAVSCAAVSLCFFIPGLVQQTGALLALAIGACFLALGLVSLRLGATIRNHWKQWIAIALAAGIGVSSGLALWWVRPFERMEVTSQGLLADVWASNDGQVREVNWGAAWEMFRDQPATGVGLGNYKVEYLDYKTRFLNHRPPNRYPFRAMRAAQAHNDYVQAVAELGIPGVLGILVLLGSFLWSTWHRCRHAPTGERKVQLLLLYTGLVVIAAHALVSFPLHLPPTGLVAVALLGMSASTSFGDRCLIKVRTTQWRSTIVRIVGAVALCALAVISGREFLSHASFTQGVAQMDAGNLDLAQELFSNALSRTLCPANTEFRLASVALLRADLARKEGDAATANSLIEQASEYAAHSVSAYPTEEGLQLVAGLAALRQDWPVVNDATSRLLASRPWMEFELNARYLAATALVKQGETGRAIDELQLLVDQYPRYVQSYILLGHLKLQRGDSQRAQQILSDALAEVNGQLARTEEALRDAGFATRRALEEDRKQLMQQQETLLMMMPDN